MIVPVGTAMTQEMQAADDRMRERVPLYDDGKALLAKLMTIDPDGRLKPWEVSMHQSVALAEALRASRKAGADPGPNIVQGLLDAIANSEGENPTDENAYISLRRLFLVRVVKRIAEDRTEIGALRSRLRSYEKSEAARDPEKPS